MSRDIEECPDCGSGDVEPVNDRLARCAECQCVDHQDLFDGLRVASADNDPVATVGDTVRAEWETRWLGREKTDEITVDKVDEAGVYMRIDGGITERWRFVPHEAFHNGGWEVVDE